MRKTLNVATTTTKKQVRTSKLTESFCLFNLRATNVKFMFNMLLVWKTTEWILSACCWWMEPNPERTISLIPSAGGGRMRFHGASSEWVTRWDRLIFCDFSATTQIKDLLLLVLTQKRKKKNQKAFLDASSCGKLYERSVTFWLKNLLHQITKITKQILNVLQIVSLSSDGSNIHNVNKKTIRNVQMLLYRVLVIPVKNNSLYLISS